MVIPYQADIWHKSTEWTLDALSCGQGHPALYLWWSVDIIECNRVHGKLVDTKGNLRARCWEPSMGVVRVTGSWPENNFKHNIVYTMLCCHYCIPAALIIGPQWNANINLKTYVHWSHTCDRWRYRHAILISTNASRTRQSIMASTWRSVVKCPFPDPSGEIFARQIS